MRTREEIEEELCNSITKAKKQETVMSFELGVIREVLLDIRELLSDK